MGRPSEEAVEVRVSAPVPETVAAVMVEAATGVYPSVRAAADAVANSVADFSPPTRRPTRRRTAIRRAS